MRMRMRLKTCFEIHHLAQRSQLSPFIKTAAGIHIHGIMDLTLDSDMSPIIDIHLPSPSIKKTHGRQTSYQGAAVANYPSPEPHTPKNAGNTPLFRSQGGGRGWLCYFLMKKKKFEVAKIFELLWSGKALAGSGKALK
jgi:hypothetical protein